MIFPTRRNRFEVVTIVDTVAVYMQDHLHRRGWERCSGRELAMILVVEQRIAIAPAVVFEDLMIVAVRVDVLHEIGVPHETACTFVGLCRTSRRHTWNGRCQHHRGHHDGSERHHRRVHGIPPDVQSTRHPAHLAVRIRKHGDRDELLPRQGGPEPEEHDEVRKGGADRRVNQDDVEEAGPDGRRDVEPPVRLETLDDVVRAVAEDRLPSGRLTADPGAPWRPPNDRRGLRRVRVAAAEPLSTLTHLPYGRT
jgi:hypothetical protein